MGEKYRVTTLLRKFEDDRTVKEYWVIEERVKFLWMKFWKPISMGSQETIEEQFDKYYKGK